MLGVISTIRDKKVYFELSRLGEDLSVQIHGGDQPHIGAVAIAYPTALSHQPNKRVTTLSSVSLPGHMEEMMARTIASKISTAIGQTVVVTCGIHIDGISKLDIELLQTDCLKYTQQVIVRLTEGEIG